ncbi:MULTISPECIES: HPr family phosphocarrier protein [unclassified Paenibacillus]|uniref:HPr family phosphocarrier protein n=1 Tax=unclassified Paenibacillus TaxID=185978 RepID=UPI001C121651|nr:MULTISPECIES: HPr family phosphocarrier protein [unclassified Paenibacillus]MBU5440749.1 HPr family phosphocarrier protein [Paenibacillus sp. MSJ-34]CAH0120395.1 Phosphocarrier protein HPr [Paenibacillus sp. CECT 9249]
MVEKRTTIRNANGLHMRPATEFVDCASAFASKISLVKDGISVDAKSMVGVISLAIACGEEIVIEAEGPDEEEALAALERVLGEMEEDA